MQQRVISRGRVLPAPFVSLAHELGWRMRQDGSVKRYDGHFCARGVKFDGCVVQQEDELYFFIYKPPTAWLNLISERGCFHPASGSWFRIGFTPEQQVKDVSSGIVRIQQVLTRAYDAFHARRQRW